MADAIVQAENKAGPSPIEGGGFFLLIGSERIYRLERHG